MLLRVKFHVFVRAGEDGLATYAGQRTVHGGPESIVDLVKERAEKIVEKKHSIELNPDVSDTLIYKVQLPKNRSGACR